jgi:hypothetical protein
MSPRKQSDLHPDLHRTLLKLDALADGSIIVDKYGHAWQKGTIVGTWYRAYDGDGHSSWDVAQWTHPVHVLRDGAA